MQMLMNVRELAAHLHLGPETIRRWTRTGRIPAVRINQRVIRYDAEAVARALWGAQESQTEQEGPARDAQESQKLQLAPKTIDGSE